MKSCIRITSLLTLILLLSSVAQAQYENTSGVQTRKKSNIPKAQRWFTGGMLGGGWSSNSAYVEVAPIIGYKVTPDFHVGSRITYIYSSITDIYDQTYSSHNYGASLFGRHRLLNFLFVQGEYEMLSVKVHYLNAPSERKLINSLFLGGGLFQSIGGNSFATIAILYDVLESDHPFYSNPLIRIGFGIGF